MIERACREDCGCAWSRRRFLCCLCEQEQKNRSKLVARVVVAVVVAAIEVTGEQ
jgi:hypothetical protein